MTHRSQYKDKIIPWKDQREDPAAIIEIDYIDNNHNIQINVSIDKQRQLPAQIPVSMFIAQRTSRYLNDA